MPDGRQGQRRIGAGAQISFHRINPNGPDANENLIVAGMGVGQLFEGHHFRAAEFVDTDCFHKLYFSQPPPSDV